MDEDQNQNKSPVVHVDNHLGLESWCCQHVYRHAHRVIFGSSAKKYYSTCHSNSCDFNDDFSSSNHHNGRQKMGQVHAAGQHQHQHQPHHPNLHAQLHKHHLPPHDILKYLNCAILINPDVATFWNYRRRLFEENRLDIRREFQFTTIVLSKKPKSNDAFAYRRWLYSFQSGESIDWIRELALCERYASKCLSNYHAWCHRQWVLQKAPELLQYELVTTERFIRKHIGDYSGYHHRQYVLKVMSDFGYFDLEPPMETDENEYAALIDLLLNLDLIDASYTMESLRKVTWLTLIEILFPQRKVNGIDDELKIKSFLFCLNAAAYDLKFTTELQELFGYREAFDSHRKASIKFIVDKYRKMLSNENYHANGETNVPNCNVDQPLKKIMKTSSSAIFKDDKFLSAMKRNENEYGNENHRKWCQVFLDF